MSRLLDAPEIRAQQEANKNLSQEEKQALRKAKKAEKAAKAAAALEKKELGSKPSTPAQPKPTQPKQTQQQPKPAPSQSKQTPTPVNTAEDPFYVIYSHSSYLPVPALLAGEIRIRGVPHFFVLRSTEGRGGDDPPALPPVGSDDPESHHLGLQSALHVPSQVHDRVRGDVPDHRGEGPRARRFQK